MYFANAPFYVSISPDVTDSELVPGIVRDRKYLALASNGDDTSLMVISEKRKLVYLPLHYLVFEGFKTNQPTVLPVKKKEGSGKPPSKDSKTTTSKAK